MGGGSVTRLWAGAAAARTRASASVLISLETKTRLRALIESNYMRFSAFALCALVCGALQAQTPVKVRVDATDAPRRLFHVRMSMPAKSGPMTLLYPEWIPGEHAPTGPIANFVGLRVQGGGQTIPWKRDGVNMYAFHIDVPAGVSSLDIAF